MLQQQLFPILDTLPYCSLSRSNSLILSTASLKLAIFSSTIAADSASVFVLPLAMIAMFLRHRQAVQASQQKAC